MSTWSRLPSPWSPNVLRSAARRRWKEQTAARIEDEIVDPAAGRSTNRFVLPVIALAMTVPTVLFIRDPHNDVAAATLAAGALALVYSLIAGAIERRVSNPFWISLANGAAYSILISTLLWAFVVFDHPRDHTHWVIFFLYFLLVGATGLSNDPRHSICAGTFSISGYLAVVLLLRADLETGGSAMAQQVAPEFEWVANSAKIAFLLGATVLAAASSQRGRELRRSSLRDSLTGLLNRRAFDQCLEHLAQGAEQHGRSLTVAMIDIDHFKHLNDSYGHQTGDEVLRWVGRWLLRGFRATDLVARYGGEEFVVAFPDSHGEGINHRLRELQREISETSVRTTAEGREVRATVSVGAARMPEDADGVFEVLARADRRLYAAKRQGRNQVVVTDEDESTIRVEPGPAPSNAL